MRGRYNTFLLKYFVPVFRVLVLPVDYNDMLCIHLSCFSGKINDKTKKIKITFLEVQLSLTPSLPKNALAWVHAYQKQIITMEVLLG
jgi:hypothetical protein